MRNLCKKEEFGGNGQSLSQRWQDITAEIGDGDRGRVARTFRFKLRKTVTEPSKHTSLDSQNVTVSKPRAVFVLWSVRLSILPDQTFFFVSNFLSQCCLVSLILWRIWKGEQALPVTPWPSLPESTPSFAWVVNISVHLQPPRHVCLSSCEPGGRVGLLCVCWSEDKSGFSSVCIWWWCLDWDVFVFCALSPPSNGGSIWKEP